MGKRNRTRSRTMDKQQEPNMNFVVDSLKVIRNQLAVLRIYLPAILTFCIVTFCLTIFLHRVNSPQPVFVISSIGTRAEDSEGSTNQTKAQLANRSLSENFNGVMSYHDLLQTKDHMSNKQTCEYGSLYQTSEYLQGNVSVSFAPESVTRTLNVMGIPNLPYSPNYRSPCFFQETLGNDIKLRCLPYFYLAGFPKCGTTDMYKRMEKHPLIASPNEKEPLWWSRDRIIHKRMGIKTSFARYVLKYSKATDQTKNKARRVTLTDGSGKSVNSIGYHPTLIGDFSTRELFNERLAWEEGRPMNAELFRHMMPCTKFIISMRDPVERLYSDYIYFLKKEPEVINPKHFHKRVVEAIHWWEDCTRQFPIQKCLFGSPKEMPPVHTGLCFDCWQGPKVCPNIRVGLYAYIIEEWLKLFPKESFLFLRMEDYTSHEVDVLNKDIFPFLGLPPLSEKVSEAVGKMERTFPAKNEDIRKTVNPDEMLPETRRILTAFYMESNQRLARLLGDDRYLWNSK